jgi:alpha-glucosidase
MGVPELLKLDYTVKELCDAVFRAPDSLIQKYLKPPFSIDGWRFDVASETGNYRSSQLGHNLWREIRTIVKRINPQAYILGEHWQESFSYVTGDQWDSAMNYFGCARPLRMWLGEADPFNLMQRREAVPGRRITGGELAALLHQHFDRIHTSFASAQFNLIDSHDVVRIHNESELFDWHHYCGAIALLFLLPGATSIYYGDEVGIAGSADGDHGKRFPMPWDPERWDQRYVRLYRELIALKRTEPALQLGGHAALHHEDDVMVFARIYHPRSVVLILNRSASRRELNIPVSLLGATTAEVLALLGQEARSLSVAAGSVTVALDSGRSALLALWNDSPDAFTHD